MHSGLLVSICKKKYKYYFDENNKVQEKETLCYDLTLDQRYFDADSTKGLFEDVIIYY